MYDGYIVTFPKKYFTSGLSTVSAPSPSHRLSRAKMLLVFFLTFCYSGDTKERPSSTV